MKPASAKLLLFLGAGAVLAGCATFAPPPPALSADGEPGREVYLRRCANCHRFYHPAAYTPARWREWMEIMAEKSRLDPAERQAVEAYLNPLRE